VEYVNLYLTLRLAMYVCLTIPVNYSRVSTYRRATNS
jgi:hypothetical protein